MSAEVVEEIANAQRVCPECAAVLPDNAALCVDCGLDLRTGKKIVAEVTADGKQETSAGVSHLWMGVGGGAIGAVLLCLLIVLFNSRGDRKAENARDLPAVAPSSLTTANGGRSDQTAQPPIIFVDLPPFVAAAVPIPAAAELVPVGATSGSPPLAQASAAPAIVSPPATPPANDPQLAAAWQRDWAAFGDELKTGRDPQEFLEDVQWTGTFDKIVDEPGGRKVIHLTMPGFNSGIPNSTKYRFSVERILLEPLKGDLQSWSRVRAGQTVTFRTTIAPHIDGSNTVLGSGPRFTVSFIGLGAKLVAVK